MAIPLPDQPILDGIGQFSAGPARDHDSTRRLAWIGSIIFGILAVISAVWLYWKVKPELLTAANAAETPQDELPSDDLSQPGGAPSA